MSKITIEAEIPKGYEAIAYRQPKVGDIILCESRNTPIGPLTVDWKDSYRIIVRKTEKWRPAELSDLSRGRIRARFRVSKKYAWVESILCGYRITAKGKWSSQMDDYPECEVLDG